MPEDDFGQPYVASRAASTRCRYATKAASAPPPPPPVTVVPNVVQAASPLFAAGPSLIEASVPAVAAMFGRVFEPVRSNGIGETIGFDPPQCSFDRPQ